MEDSRQPKTLSASTSGYAKAIIATVVTEEAEGPGQSAGLEAIKAEAAHRTYRNSRVSKTILRHHQSQDVEHILSFDITDPTFEMEVLSKLIACEEKDDAGIDEGDETLPKFQSYDDDPEGRNLHVEEET